jgi:hypothetical protein
MGLKELANWGSPSAFQDYFQMGISMGQLCLKNICKAISHSDELRSLFMQQMT